MRRQLVLALALATIACNPVQSSHKAFLARRVATAHLDSLLLGSDSTYLTLGEARALFGVALSGAFGEKLPKDTMTVQEILAWTGEAKKRQEQRKAQADSLAAAERARLASIQAAMDTVLVVALVRKGFTPSDISSGRYDDYITMSFAYHNKGSRDLRAFQGTVTFLDVFGDTVYAANLKVDDPIKAGRTLRQERTLEYNQFRAEQRKFRDAALNNLKVIWQPRTVLFADGTSLSAITTE